MTPPRSRRSTQPPPQDEEPAISAAQETEQAQVGRWPGGDQQAAPRSASPSVRRAGSRDERPTRGVGPDAQKSRRRGARPAGRAGGPSAAGKRPPLYSRLLGLKHIAPNVWQRALLGEGSLAAGIVLVLADLATAWTIVVLPLAVAVVVKAHDLLAGYLQRPARVRPAKEPKARRTKSRPAPEPKTAGRTRRSRRAAGLAAPGNEESAPEQWSADADGAGPPQEPAPSGRRRKT